MPTLASWEAPSYSDRIALTAYLERQLWEIIDDTMRGAPGFSEAGPDLGVLAALKEKDEHTMAAIDHALVTIDRFGPATEWTLQTTAPASHQDD